MKKISLFVLMMAGSITLMAQHAPVWGIKGGLNVASWKHQYKENQEDLGSRLGFHIGLLSHNHLTDKIAIQPEIQFSTQGAELEAGSNDIESRMSYINIPVMFQYMFDNGFRLEAGPYVGFLVGARDVNAAGTERDSKTDYNKIDAGLGLGLNYLSYSGFGIGGRYNIGLTDIYERPDVKIQNRVFQVSVFYMLDSDHKRKSR